MMRFVLRFGLLCISICLLAASVVPETHKAQKDPLSDKQHFNEEKEHNADFDHEAFLGREDAQQFKELTPEQSKERLEKLIPAIDKDEDKLVSEAELKDHIKFMQKRYITNDVSRSWKSHATKDGKLEWSEYRSSVYGPEDTERPLEPEYKAMLDRDQHRWGVADLDKDQSLSKEEFTCYMHPEDCEHMKDTVVKETIADIDKDKDGYINLDEYIGDMYRPDENEASKQEPDWVKSERDMFKQYRDKDGDGKLNKEEMREWIMPTGFDHAEAEAKHLLHMADDDKDGQLSPEEILTHYDVFVGSQATDYGEQLQKHDPAEL